MYKVIVVGTDGSERAGVAVKEAMAWAKAYGATLHAVNVVHPAANSEFADSLQTQVQVGDMRDEKDRIKAQLLAEAEAEEYVDDLDDEYLGLAQSYRLPTEPVHGAEVFSLIRRSSLTPQAYLGAFFATGTEVTGLLGEP